MSSGAVKATCNEDNLRCKVSCDGHEDGAESSQVLGIAHRRTESSRPANVDVEASTSARTRLCKVARAREKLSLVVSVQANVEDRGVLVEGLLKTIAVVDVPVDNEDALETEFALQLFGSNGQ